MANPVGAAISNGADANASVVNAELDKLGNRIGAAASSSGSIATSIDTDGTLKAGAVDNAAAVADSILTYAKMNADAKFSDANTLYEVRGDVVWDPATHDLTLGTRVDIIFGQDTSSILTCTSQIVIDFDNLGSNYQYAYLTGVDRAASDTFIPGDIVVETRGALSANLQDKTTLVIATYSPTSNEVWSPFLAPRVQTQYQTFANVMNMPGFTYGEVEWDNATEQLRFHENCYWIHDGIYFTQLTGPSTIDFSGATASDLVFAYIPGVDFATTATETRTDSAIVVEARANLARSLLRRDMLVVATYNRASGEIWSPFLVGQLGRSVINKPKFVNHYPNIYSKIPNFTAKYLAGDSDITIVLWGDSLLARETWTSSWNVDATALPPLLASKNFAWWLWTYGFSNDRKATYRRYDYTSYFTETGTWVSAAGGENGATDTNWDDEGDRPSTTRISDSTTAAVEWTLAGDADKTGCTFIYRTDTAGDAAATIAVSEGDSYLEAWNGSTWVEANAYTFSMLEADEGARRGNTIFQKRQKLRKVDAHDGDSVTISVGKASTDTDRLLYWGIEYYDKTKPIVRLINSARGNHSIDATGLKLYDYMDDDVIDMAPDLVLFQLPLLNQIASGTATRASVSAAVQDVIWGDRSGSTNTWALLQNAETANNEQWDDFETLVVIPHHSLAHFDTDGNFQTGTAPLDDGESAKAIYDGVKGLLISQGDVGFIDVSTAFLRAIDADTVGNRYDALLDRTTSNGSDTRDTYTADDTHQNDKGTRIWAEEIVPVFHFTGL